MKIQILESNGRPAFAVVPWSDYVALRELAEDAEDVAVLQRFARRYAAGKEETVPASVVDRILAGDSPLRVWREHRGMTATALAREAGITAAHVSKIESGKGDPSLSVLKKLAKALDVALEDLAGR